MFRLSGLYVITLLVLSGCGARTSLNTASTDAGPIPESCERYLDHYSACMLRLGQPASAVEGRVAAARARLATDGDHAQLGPHCTSDLAQLRAACP